MGRTFPSAALRHLMRVAAAALLLIPAAAAAEPLRIATEAAFPPFNFVNDRGEIDGFERQFGDELCRRIDAQCTWVKNDWDSLIPNLLSGNYDVIMAAMNITDERRKTIDFSDAYTLPVPSAYVAADPSQDVTAAPVAAQANTIHAAYVASTGAAVVEFTTPEETVAAVRNGEADAVFADRDFLAPFVTESGGGLSFVTGQDRIPLGEGFGLGLRKSDADLTARINEAIRAMKADGSLNAMLVQWFGPDTVTFDDPAKPAP